MADADTPDARIHVLVEHQVWACFDDPTDSLLATVGITALGVQAAGGEIYMCRAKPVGTVVEQGRSLAVVELAKAIVSVKAPLSGRIEAINEALAERPERVHEEPEGGGWIARLRCTSLDTEVPQLASGTALDAAQTEYRRLMLLGNGEATT
jgi:glycine cleavage system H protein